MRPSVLVVENHRDLSAQIVEALERAEYACESVRNGQAAILKLREHEYGYILIDDDEATDAGPLLARLEAEPATKKKLVVMSDFDQDDVASLRKPFDSKALLARLKP